MICGCWMCGVVGVCINRVLNEKCFCLLPGVVIRLMLLSGHCWCQGILRNDIANLKVL